MTNLPDRMRFLILLLTVISIIVTSCLEKSDTIEIYLAEDVSPDFTSGFEDGCRYCFDHDKAKRASTPLITTADIEHFSWKEQRIQLKATGLAKISKLKIPLSGLPTVLMVNSKPVYGLWFWNYHSSFACDQVCTFPQYDFKILFGFPEKYKKGIDPRFSEELKTALTNLYLLQ